MVSITGTITLTTGELVIARNLTITGPGATNLAISGHNDSRVFNISSASATVSISGLTVCDGKAPEGLPGVNGTDGSGDPGGPGDPGGAGGIYGTNSLAITACTLAANTAGGGGNGGNGGNGGLGGQLTSGWQPDGRAIDPFSLTASFDSASRISLEAFNGHDPNGSWTLCIADVSAGGGQSHVGSWELDLTAVPEPGQWALAMGTVVLAWVWWRRQVGRGS